MKKITLLFAFIAMLFSFNSNAQCINTSGYGTYSAVNDWNVQTLGDCNYTTEYSTISALIVGNDYQIDLTDNSDGAQNYVTVTDVADAVIAHGATPFTWTATATDVRFHWTDDAACATTSSCHTSTLYNLSVTPPTCAPPTGLGATSGETTADISWSAPGSGTPVGYNWEIQPVGVAQGTAGAPASGTTTGTTETATGLTAITDYDLFVQTDCGGDGTSTWEGPFSFTTTGPPPANDDCVNAIMLTAGAAYADNPVDGTGLDSATDSGFTNSCDSTTDLSGVRDAWFSVVVPATGHLTIETEADIATGTAGCDTLIEVYTTDSDCAGTLTSIGCDDDGAATGAYSKLDLTSLVAGATLYVRVWGYGDDEFEPYSISAFDDGTLDVSATQFEGFKYFPNPVKGTLSLRAQDNMQNVAVLNMLGQEVMNVSPNAMSDELDMSALSNGTYFVRVNINGAIENFKVIKE